jgi:hypothetical protein
MRIVEINGIDYKCFNAWEDITLRRFVRLCLSPMPDKLLSLFKSVHDPAAYEEAFKAVTYEDTMKHFPAYFGEVIKILSDIPEDIVELIPGEDRETLYYKIFHHIALSSVHSMPFIRPENELIPYEPIQDRSFDFRGGTYFFPKTLRLNGLEVPMANEPIITFTEAADIMTSWLKMAEKGSGNIALLAAIYCRKNGEEYDQDTALSRAEAFEDLTMDIYWGLFFCMDGLTKRLVSDIPNSIIRFAQTKKKRLQILPNSIHLEVGG